MSDEYPEYVWVAEAYNEHGARVEQILHRHEDDAWEDIEACTEGQDVIHSVKKKRLYSGKDAIVGGH